MISRITKSAKSTDNNSSNADFHVDMQSPQKEGSVVDTFERAIGTAGIITVNLEPEYEIIEFSRGAEIMFGYKERDLLGKPLSILLSESIYLPQRSSQIMRNGRVVPDILLVKKFGETFPALLLLTHINYEIGKPSTGQVIVIDKTPISKLEREYYRAEELSKCIFENSIDIVSLLDTEGKILQVSPSIETVLGYVPQEMLGKRPFEEICQEDVSSATDYSMPGLHNLEEKKKIRIHLKDKDGLPRVMESCGKAVIVDSNLEGFIVHSRDITEQVNLQNELKASNHKFRKVLYDGISCMSKTLESRDPYTAGHQVEVSRFANAIAKKMGLSTPIIKGVTLGGLIHDIGKIALPAEVVNKPGRLTSLEFRLMKEHCQLGYTILKDFDFQWPIAEMVLQHHERIDGSGYPQGLKNKEIILEARILGVADVVRAMLSHRPYRPALTIDKVMEEITRNKGKLYDPDVVDACLSLLKEAPLS